MGVRGQLRKELNSHALVRVRLSPKHADPLSGFVVGLGKKWALIALTMDGGYFDGYMAFRVKDVARVLSDGGFEGLFARTQPEWPPTGTSVDLDSTVGVIRSLAATSPLVGIEKSRRGPRISIGTLVKAGKTWTWVHEVDREGVWETQPFRHRTRRITNVQIGTHYLTALSQTMEDQPDLDG